MHENTVPFQAFYTRPSTGRFIFPPQEHDEFFAMTMTAPSFLWASLRRFLGVSTDVSLSHAVPARTLLFQLVESEVCVADALLDLDDLTGCDEHMTTALRLAEDLRGPENMLMHQRVRELQIKRAQRKQHRTAYTPYKIR